MVLSLLEWFYQCLNGFISALMIFMNTLVTSSHLKVGLEVPKAFRKLQKIEGGGGITIK